MNKITIAIWAKTNEDACEIFDALRKELCAMYIASPAFLPYDFTIKGENYKLIIFPDCSAKYGVMGRSFDYMYCFPDTAEYKSRLKQNGVFQQYALYGDIIDVIVDATPIKELLDLNGMKPKLRIKNVIFNDPATIVFWFDGTKTVVKCQKGETFDKEKGLAMAISKKILGSNISGSNFNEVFKKWCKE